MICISMKRIERIYGNYMDKKIEKKIMKMPHQ